MMPAASTLHCPGRLAHRSLWHDPVAWRAIPFERFLLAGETIDRSIVTDIAPGWLHWIEVRRCRCGARMGRAFVPDAVGLEALRWSGLTAAQLSELWGRGSREAGIVLQERGLGGCR